MKPNERLVSFYDLRVESTFWGEKDLRPPPVSTHDALAVARKVMSGQPFCDGRSKVQVTLEDWVYKPTLREHYLLFNRTDASLDDIPLRDTKSGSKRMAGKSPTEGIDLSAHVLIREHEDPNKPALLLMTQGSSLPIDKVARMLSRLFRNGEHLKEFERHFVRPDPSGAEDKTRKLRSQFLVDGHQNAALSKILRGGGLVGVDLISDSESMLDEEHKLQIASTEFKVIPLKPGASLTVTALMRAIAGAPRHIDLARVHFRAPGSSRDESQTFKAENLDAAFVRKEQIRFQSTLAARYDKISMEVIDKLRQLT